MDRSIPFSIVVAFDFTQTGARAFELGVRFARRIAGAQLHVVYVLSDAAGALAEERGAMLRQHVVDNGAAMDDVNLYVRVGEVAERVAEVAAECDADLVLLGGVGHRHLHELFSGPLATRLEAGIACPVVLAGPVPRPLRASVAPQATRTGTGG
jgi:nucleotide-binding universal stress UspA family protein